MISSATCTTGHLNYQDEQLGGYECSIWQSKKVLITGHTGFKGSWLSLWLQSLGVEVVGYAVDSPTEPRSKHVR
jgi:hypothetical protein